MTLDELLALVWQHEQQIWDIEDNTAEQVLKAYKQASKVLRAALQDILDTWAQAGYPNTAFQRVILARHAGVIYQIEQRVAVLNRELKDIITSARNEIVTVTLDNYLIELHSVGLGLSFGRFDPVMVEFALESVIDEIDYFTDKVKNRLLFRFRVAVLQGKGIDEIVRLLLSDTIMPRSIWRGGRNGCDVLVRMILLKAHNTSKQVQMARVHELIPEIRKQAIAVIDRRTTICCLDIHGRVIAVDQLFATVYGRFLFPPFHVRCRTTIITWHKLIDPKGTSTRAMKLAARTEKKKRK